MSNSIFSPIHKSPEIVEEEEEEEEEGNWCARDTLHSFADGKIERIRKLYLRGQRVSSS